jgi:KaiC/GvpD/RAD55 family RecA-like ATPase
VSEIFAPSEIQSYWTTRVPDLRFNGHREVRTKCPIHGGERDSFSINSETGFAICHSGCGGQGWDLIGFEKQISGMDFVKAKAEVYRIVGRQEPNWEDRDVEAKYDYRDEHGELRYQVVRKFGKKFSQRRPDGKGGWVWGLGGVAPLPYNLPKILKTNTVIAVVEGERDADNVSRLGMPATCNSGGAGNFKPELANYFTGKPVAIFGDNDEPGRKHAVAVAKLLQPVAASVKIVEIPGLPLKGDVSDFIAKSGTLDQINALYAKAPEWSPDFEFPPSLPHEDDKYTRDLAAVIEAAGGLDQFWDLTKFTGIATPFAKLNRALGGGMRAGEYYVIAARTGKGKSSLALQFAITALKAGHRSLIFSLEMGDDPIFKRMCGIEAHVDLLEFAEAQRAGKDTSAERLRLARAMNEIGKLSPFVCTRSGITPKFIVTETKRQAERHKINLVIVDHKGLVEPDSATRTAYERSMAVTRALKQVAVDLNVPVILVSQVSRENARDHRAELEITDLRDGGEEDPAGVFLIYEDREDAAQAKKFDNGRRYSHGPVKTWLKVGKNRYGIGDCSLPLFHHKSECRFEYSGDHQ